MKRLLLLLLLVMPLSAQTVIFVVPDQAATQEGRITLVSRDGYGAGAPKGVTFYAPASLPSGAYQLIWPTTKPASGEVLAYSSEPSAGTIQLDWISGAGGGGDVFTALENVFTNAPQTITATSEAAQLVLNTNWNLSGAFSRVYGRTYPGAGNTGRGLILGGVAYGGTSGTPTATPTGSTLVELRGGGYDGSGERSDQGSLIIEAGGTWTGSSAPTQIRLRTTPSASLTERDVMRLEAAGGVFFLAGDVIQTGGNFITRGTAFQVASSGGTVAHSWLASGTSNVSSIVNSAAQDVIRLDSQAGIVYIGNGQAHNLNVAGDVQPSSTLARDLGKTGARWLHIYGGDLTLTTGIVSDITAHHIRPAAHNTYELGTAGNIWSIVNSSLYQAGANASITGGIRFFNASVSGNAELNGRSVTGAVDIEFGLGTGAAAYPDTNNAHDFGLATRRWQVIYVGTAVNAPNGSNGMSGTCASSTTLTVSGGIITGCS